MIKKTIFVLLCLFLLTAVAAGADEPVKFKMAIADPQVIKVGEYQIFHQGYAAMLAFQSALEKYAPGAFDVEIYPGGRLGDVRSAMEQVLSGTIAATQTADGFVGSFYKNIQILNAPYVLKDPIQAYEILDGPFGQKLFQDMAEKSGFRVLSVYDNGGFRAFSNSKKEIRVPDDMKGMKIRVMDTPIYQEIVAATGASATPIAWLELYSALQTGVVDGEENAPIQVLSGSLQEVQKYYTLNNHVFSMLFIVMNEDQFQSYPSDVQAALLRAGKEGSIAGRGICRAADSLALQAIKDYGLQVYVPTAEERKLWEKTGEKAVQWLRENTDAALVDELIEAAKTGEQTTGVVAAAGDAAQEKSSGGVLVYILGAAILVLLAYIGYSKKKKVSA